MAFKPVQASLGGLRIACRVMKHRPFKIPGSFATEALDIHMRPKTARPHQLQSRTEVCVEKIACSILLGLGRSVYGQAIGWNMPGRCAGHVFCAGLIELQLTSCPNWINHNHTCHTHTHRHTHARTSANESLAPARLYENQGPQRQASLRPRSNRKIQRRRRRRRRTAAFCP